MGPGSGSLRVLALVHLPPPVHGVSLINERLIRGAVGEIVDLHVVPLRFARNIEDLGRPGVGKVVRAALVGAKMVHAQLLKRPDVAYITPTTHGAGLIRDAIYMHLFRLHGTPYVAHIHTMGLPASLRALGPGARKLVTTAYRGAAQVVALNRVHARELASVVGRERIGIVPNALPDLVDGPSFSTPEESPLRNRILFLSNLLPEKGGEVLLEALQGVRSVAGDLVPTFAGAWPGTEVRTRFERRAANLGVADWIDVRGPVDETSKRLLLDETLILAFPSYYPYECAPLVVLEAMRQGVAVVSTRQGGIPELVDHGVTGVLVDPRDVGALGSALADLATDRARAVQYGRQGRRKFEATHLQDHWDAAILHLFLDSAA